MVASKEPLGGALDLVNFQFSSASRFMLCYVSGEMLQGIMGKMNIVFTIQLFFLKYKQESVFSFCPKNEPKLTWSFICFCFTNRIYATLLMGVHHASISFLWLTNREYITIDFLICPFVNCTGLEGWLYSQTFLLLSVKILRWYHHQ